jgi:hypothetical protein
MGQIAFVWHGIALAALATTFVLSVGHAGRAAEPIAGPRIGALVDAGKGDDKASFVDFNVHPQPPVHTTAAIYFSWFAADGPAAFPANIAGFDRAAWLLWIDGPDEVHDKKRWRVPQVEAVKAKPNARYELIEARHLEVPAAAVPLVIDWLRSLR